MIQAEQLLGLQLWHTSLLAKSGFSIPFSPGCMGLWVGLVSPFCCPFCFSLRRSFLSLQNKEVNVSQQLGFYWPSNSHPLQTNEINLSLQAIHLVTRNLPCNTTSHLYNVDTWVSWVCMFSVSHSNKAKCNIALTKELALVKHPSDLLKVSCLYNVTHFFEGVPDSFGGFLQMKVISLCCMWM